MRVATAAPWIRVIPTLGLSVRLPTHSSEIVRLSDSRISRKVFSGAITSQNTPAQPRGLSLSDWGCPLFDNRTSEKLAMAMRDAFEGCKGSGVAGGTSPDVREGRWRADYPMIQINAVALLPPTMAAFEGPFNHHDR